MDFYLGTVTAFAFGYITPNWMPCDGRLLQVRQFTALFAVIGNVYGGDGTTTFGLPDLRGRVAIGMGQGSGQPNYNISNTGGANSVTLSVQNLAAHTHPGTLAVVGTAKSTVAPAAGNILLTATTVPATTATTTVPLGGVATQPAGLGQAFSIMPPYIALNYMICVQGIYPPRQ